MLEEKIVAEGMAGLKGRILADVRIGLELLAVRLNDGRVAITYVLRDELEDVSQLLPEGGSLVGRRAEEVASWFLLPGNVLKRALGLAVINAEAGAGQNLASGDATDFPGILPGEKVGIVGKMGPIMSRVSQLGNSWTAFGREELRTRQREELPSCQVVFITASALINGTLEEVLSSCTGAREVVLTGTSTPLLPRAFSGTGVTLLAGTCWRAEEGEDLLAGVSQAATIRTLISKGRKTALSVPPGRALQGNINMLS